MLQAEAVTTRSIARKSSVGELRSVEWRFTYRDGRSAVRDRGTTRKRQGR